MQNIWLKRRKKNECNRLVKKKLEFSVLKVEPKVADIIEEQNLGKIIDKSSDKHTVIINNPTINVYKLDKSVLEDLSDLFFIGKMDVIEESMVSEEALLINNIKNVLKKIEPYLSGEDYGALSYASYMIKLEDKGKDVEELHRKLFDTYGHRGARIYSLLRANIFETDILPLIKEDAKREEISEHINKMITAPEAIFVSKFMNKNSIKKQIENRFSRGINSFQIFARASGVKTATEAIEETIKKEKHVACKVEKYPLGEKEAVTITVQKFVKIDTIT